MTLDCESPQKHKSVSVVCTVDDLTGEVLLDLLFGYDCLQPRIARGVAEGLAG